MSTTLPLSPGQIQITKWLVSFFFEHGMFPTTREIQAHFGHKSNTAAMSFCRALQKKGVLRQPDERKSRAITIVWQKVIEFALYIWEPMELNDYYYHAVFKGGDESDTIKLPHWSMISLWLQQEGREPVEFKIEKIKP